MIRFSKAEILFAGTNLDLPIKVLQISSYANSRLRNYIEEKQRIEFFNLIMGKLK